MAIIEQTIGLGAAGDCPIRPDGNCESPWGGLVNCRMLRECDSVTGQLHWEYQLPFGSPNANVNVSADGVNITGYNDAQGHYVAYDKPVPIATLQNAPSLATQATGLTNDLEKIKADAAAQAASQGMNAFQTAIHIATAVAKAAAEVPKFINTQAGQVNAGSLVNTPQTTTSQQGTPNSSGTSMVNNNVGNSSGSSGSSANNNKGNNSVTPTPGSIISIPGSMNFKDLMSAGSSWLEQESYGVKNSYWAIGAAIAIAIGGGYVGGRRRGF